MSLGTAWTTDGTTGLWHIIFDINADERGFTQTFKVAQASEAEARAVAVDLGTRMLTLLPITTEIFFAKISRTDSGRDALMIPEVMGPGLYQSAAGPPVVNPPEDQHSTCLLLRLEDTRNTPVPFKFCPIPDNIVTGSKIIAKPDSVLGVPVALPAVNVVGEAYKLGLEKLMGAIVKQTHHIVGETKGGIAYTYFAWKNCHFNRTGKKKGGRVFIG